MKTKSFSKKIIVYIFLLMTVFFAAVGVYYNISIYKNLRQAALQKAEVQIEHTNDTVNTNFDILKLMMYKILGNDSLVSFFEKNTLSGSDLKKAEQYLSNDIYSSYCWTNGIIKSVYIFKNENTYIRTTRAPYYAAEIEENKNIYLLNREKSGMVITTLDKKRECFYFSVSFENNTEKIGYIVFAIDAARLSDTLKNVRVDDSNVYVIDENNVIYASAQNDVIGEKLVTESLYKKERLDSESRLFVATEILYSDINRNLRKSLYVYIIVFIVVIFSALAVTTLTVQSLTKPLRMLVDSIKLFDEGNWKARAPHYNDDEIDMIGTAFNNMCENISNLVNVVYQKEILLRDAQLQALRAQMNPHFLFNTLTTIATIAKKDKNELVSNMIRTLSKLLRERIITDNDDFSTLIEELQLVDYYVYIQKIRFGEHINYRLLKADDVSDNCIVPKLVLQPLVENAVSHGLEKSIDGGTVSVKISQSGKYIILEVTDDGIGFDTNQKLTDGIHKHISLKNIRRRFEVYFGDDFEFDITSKIGVGTRAFVKFPSGKKNPNLSKISL